VLKSHSGLGGVIAIVGLVSAACSGLSSTPASSASPFGIAAPSTSALASALVPGASPTSTLPMPLAAMKAVDLAGYGATPSRRADPYVLSLVGDRALLTYDTGKAKGSIQIDATKGELAYLSRASALERTATWNPAYLVVILVAQDEYGINQIDDPSSPTTPPPMSWRILVASLDGTGKPMGAVEFARGVSSLSVETPNFECGACSFQKYVQPPVVALSGDRIAYSVERPTAAQPFASQIIVRSLADGSIVRSVAVPQYVSVIKMSGPTLAWLDYPGATSNGLPLRISTAAHPDAQTLLTYVTPGGLDVANVQWDMPPFFLSGSQLVWQASAAGEVLLRELPDGEVRQISPDGLTCSLADYDGVNAVMACTDEPCQTAWDTRFMPRWLVLWSPTSGSRLLAGFTTDGWYSATFENGYLRVNSSAPDASEIEWSLPLSDLIRD
jgi:hypothetical protein